jgi:hypothetical protein
MQRLNKLVCSIFKTVLKAILMSASKEKALCLVFSATNTSSFSRKDVETNTLAYFSTRVTRTSEKIAQFFKKELKQSLAKSVYNKAQFEGPKHLHQTHF